MLSGQIACFITALDEERYYDAHEALELLWFMRRFEAAADVKVMKGFINAAVSFELIKRGRHEAAKRVWKNYEKYAVLVEAVPPEQRAQFLKAQVKILTIRSRYGHIYGCDGVSPRVQEV